MYTQAYRDNSLITEAMEDASLRSPRPGLLTGFVTCLLLLVTATASAVQGANRLQFKLSDETYVELSTAQINEQIESETIEIFDPHHGKSKRYRGWKLRSVLQAAFGESLDQDKLTDAVMLALDGYALVSTKSKLLEAGGYIVYDELDIPTGWERIGRHEADPAPYYFVWSNESQSTAAGYPWPWQLASIPLVTFEQRYPAVVPVDVAQSSSVHPGYEIFKKRCVRCHAVNQQGGKIGPDLNYPKNILVYRSASMVRSFIQNAAAFRQGRMPSQLDLGAAQLDNLLDYLLPTWPAEFVWL